MDRSVALPPNQHLDCVSSYFSSQLSFHAWAKSTMRMSWMRRKTNAPIIPIIIHAEIRTTEMFTNQWTARLNLDCTLARELTSVIVTIDCTLAGELTSVVVTIDCTLAGELTSVLESGLLGEKDTLFTNKLSNCLGRVFYILSKLVFNLM